MTQKPNNASHNESQFSKAQSQALARKAGCFNDGDYRRALDLANHILPAEHFCPIVKMVNAAASETGIKCSKYLLAAILVERGIQVRNFSGGQILARAWYPCADLPKDLASIEDENIALAGLDDQHKMAFGLALGRLLLRTFPEFNPLSTKGVA